MNYFSHALPFLTDPYFMAGTAVPDWLGVADRGVRMRPKNVEPLAADPNRETAAVAGGLLQHFRDDAQFHQTRAFTEINLELSAAIRRVLAADSDVSGPVFSATCWSRYFWTGRWPRITPAAWMPTIGPWNWSNPPSVQEAVNRMSARGTDRLAPMIFLFCRERILWDYGQDGKLMVRMNQVMRRVGFPPLPESVQELFPAARQLVRRRQHELLEGIPVR